MKFIKARIFVGRNDNFSRKKKTMTLLKQCCCTVNYVVPFRFRVHPDRQLSPWYANCPRPSSRYRRQLRFAAPTRGKKPCWAAQVGDPSRTAELSRLRAFPSRGQRRVVSSCFTIDRTPRRCPSRPDRDSTAWPYAGISQLGKSSDSRLLFKTLSISIEQFFAI